MGILAAVVIIIGWAILGPYFRYSDTWQLVINTATTIITFLMVFLIQNTQNRDARAIHLKLDELIRCLDLAHNDMINVEKLSDEELAVLSQKFDNIRNEFENRKQRKYGKPQNGQSAT
jgi:low affinity Fe/Cu permease